MAQAEHYNSLEQSFLEALRAVNPTSATQPRAKLLVKVASMMAEGSGVENVSAAVHSLSVRLTLLAIASQYSGSSSWSILAQRLGVRNQVRLYLEDSFKDVLLASNGAGRQDRVLEVIPGAGLHKFLTILNGELDRDPNAVEFHFKAVREQIGVDVEAICLNSDRTFESSLIQIGRSVGLAGLMNVLSAPILSRSNLSQVIPIQTHKWILESWLQVSTRRRAYMQPVSIFEPTSTRGMTPGSR